MYYAVIQRPEADVSTIQAVRAKYDPTFGLIGPHISLVFPVPSDKVDLELLQIHVATVARATTPFQTRFLNLELSWDQWLFLTPEEGREEFDTLHGKLYQGILKRFLRADIPFVPHIALGHFAIPDSTYSLKDPKAVALDRDKYEKAREQIDTLAIRLAYTATKLEVVGVDDEFTKSETLQIHCFRT